MTGDVAHVHAFERAQGRKLAPAVVVEAARSFVALARELVGP